MSSPTFPKTADLHRNGAPPGSGVGVLPFTVNPVTPTGSTNCDTGIVTFTPWHPDAQHLTLKLCVIVILLLLRFDHFPFTAVKLNTRHDKQSLLLQFAARLSILLFVQH